jgi:prolyl-tRNA synthetase
MADLPDKNGAFIDWYLEVVERSQLSDKRYPVKGMNVWTPYGLRTRRLLDATIIREIEATGSEAVEFPTLIPETEFGKEREHIKGFDREVFWVTRGGATTLEIPLVLRPTSESAIYPVFALWVRSHRDLPLNVYQIVNTFRYDTKTTRPFLRVREIHFFEEHTCQVDEAAATSRVESNMAAFERMARVWVLPYVPVRRPEWDKFPGAFYSIAFDLPLVQARTLQLGTVHHYRENFARPYGIAYEDTEGRQRFAHQTTFGLSERLLGAALATHGDQKGAVFPSGLAPTQVVIIPIPDPQGGSAPETFSHAVLERLRGAGIRAHLDDRDDRPGAKYYYWEERGVPLRLDVGRREAAAQTVTATDRLGHRATLGPETIEKRVQDALTAFDARLAERAQAVYRAQFAVASDLSSLREADRLQVVPWCGEERCGHAIEDAIGGALLGTPEAKLPIDLPPLPPCISCGATETRWALAGRPI